MLAFGLLLIAVSIFVIVRVNGVTTIGGSSETYSKQLTELELSGSDVQSLEGLDKLSDLRSLSLYGLGLSDVDTVMQCASLESLDLRGNAVSIDKYDELQLALPDCRILWDVPVCGELVPSDAKIYTLTSQEPSEYPMLAYLKELEYVDATGAVLSPELVAISHRLAECEFHWTVDIAGMTVDSAVEGLDFSGKRIKNLDAFTQALGYLPKATRVEMCDCGLSNQQMETLCETFPWIRFVWRINLGVWDLRTDATNFSVANTTHQPLIPREDMYQLKYCTDLIALDMGHQNFSDLTPLSGLTGLKALILSDCGITDISPLAGLVNLEFAELMENKITDISVIANWTKLERVCLFINNISDFSPLYDLEKLRRVWINKNPGVKAKHKKIASNLPEGCDLCTTTRPTGQGYGWRPINYSKLGFTYSHRLNGRSPAGAEGDSYPE